MSTLNYASYLSRISAARKQSPIRAITALLSRSPPTMISLAAGAPSAEMFPFLQASFRLKNGEVIELDESVMNKALQYSPSAGVNELLDTLKRIQSHYHTPPTMKSDLLDICVTTGSQDGLSKVFEMLLEEGQPLLCETPTYSGTLAVLKPLGVEIVEVATDERGLKPDSLKAVLATLQQQRTPDRMPKVLYTSPTASNPGGVTLPDDRKRVIYEIAKEFNLLIIEDDPYYFLQFQKPRTTSFLSLDVDGRVIRLDSFSKLLSSGLRVGFVTGPKPLIERVVLHSQISTMHCSGLSQMLVWKLLDRWGIEGFDAHADKVTEFYCKKMEVMVGAAEKHLKGLAVWNKPSGGMFMWMRLLGINDSSNLINEKAVKKEVLLVPGNAFMLDDTQPTPYVRASYSLATPEQIETGVKRLAELIREEQRQ